MGFELGQTVQVKDKLSVRNDDHLEESALDIIVKNNFRGEVTKIDEGINFVGFKNDLGWVTQGYKDNEIERVK